jgi:predicted secreted protein
MRRFLNLLLITVIGIGLCNASWAAGQPVLQSAVTVPVTEVQTNATVNIEREGKVTLDASENENSGTFSWKFLEGPENVTLRASDTLSPYFRPPVPGVYSFALEISDGTTIIETKEVTLEVRDLYYVDLGQPGSYTMDIETYPIAYPTEWISYGAVGFGTGASTTDNPLIAINGTAELHTVTLKCKNLTTGVEHGGVTLEKDGVLEFSFNVVLQEGDNLVEVTGEDDLGAICRDARFITYNSSVTFIEHLALSEKLLVEGHEKDIEFSLKAKFSEGYPIPDKIDLYEVSGSSGNLRNR